MAVVVSIARGHDASYPFKTTGAAESPVITGQCEAGYYRSVVEKGGEPAGTRRFWLEWTYRPASKGRVIAGFPEKARAQFSSRWAQITKTTLALAEQYEKDRGHALDEQALASRGRFANAIRRAQRAPARWTSPRCRTAGNGPRVWPSLRRCATSYEPSGVAPDATARTGTRRDTRVELARMSARLASRGELTHAQERAVMAAGLTRAQESRAGRCAARHRHLATTSAATRVRGWRLGERSG